MKKIFLGKIILCLLILFFIPVLTKAALVSCGNGDAGSGFKYDCKLDALFGVFNTIYHVIVLDIAGPAAILAITIGGVMMLISAGDPGLMSRGKTILYSGVIGLVLATCAYLIVDTIAKNLKVPDWAKPPVSIEKNFNTKT